MASVGEFRFVQWDAKSFDSTNWTTVESELIEQDWINQ